MNELTMFSATVMVLSRSEDVKEAAELLSVMLHCVCAPLFQMVHGVTSNSAQQHVIGGMHVAMLAGLVVDVVSLSA